MKTLKRTSRINTMNTQSPRSSAYKLGYHVGFTGSPYGSDRPQQAWSDYLWGYRNGTFDRQNGKDPEDLFPEPIE